MDIRARVCMIRAALVLPCIVCDTSASSRVITGLPEINRSQFHPAGHARLSTITESVSVLILK